MWSQKPLRRLRTDDHLDRQSSTPTDGTGIPGAACCADRCRSTGVPAPGALYWVFTCAIVQPLVTPAAIPVGTPGPARTVRRARRTGTPATPTAAAAHPCAGHRHLFSPDGDLHCVVPNNNKFGQSVGLAHPKNLGQVRELQHDCHLIVT